jgi:hypothetical protein
MLIENPIRARPSWTRGRIGAIALIAAMLAVALLWLVLPRPDLGVGTVNVDLL